jgi:hypothetical protein
VNDNTANLEQPLLLPPYLPGHLQALALVGELIREFGQAEQLAVLYLELVHIDLPCQRRFGWRC